MGHAALIGRRSRASADVFAERMETLVAAMQQDAGVRLPGYRRFELARIARAEGIEVAAPLLEQLEAVASAA